MFPRVFWDEMGVKALKTEIPMSTQVDSDINTAEYWETLHKRKKLR